MLHHMTAVLIALMDSLAETVFAGQPLTWTLKMLHHLRQESAQPIHRNRRYYKLHHLLRYLIPFRTYHNEADVCRGIALTGPDVLMQVLYSLEVPAKVSFLAYEVQLRQKVASAILLPGQEALV